MVAQSATIIALCAIMVAMSFGKERQMRHIVNNIKNTKEVFVLITVGFSAQLCNRNRRYNKRRNDLFLSYNYTLKLHVRDTRPCLFVF